MKEIKFRAWDKAEKRWYDYEDSEIFIDLHGQPLIYTAENPYPFANTDIELMQYTGLKDKNGKEIYEGDIIWWGKDEPAPASNVIFDDGAFKVSDTRELLADVLNGAEVISNVHDSPDFLGVTE